jgi:hypothetical protein
MSSSNLVRIQELTEFSLTSLVINEYVGFELPTGVLKVGVSPTNYDPSIKELNISVIIEDDEILAKAFVEDIKYLNGSVIFKLVFVPEEYFTLQKIRNYSGLSNMIRRCTPNPIQGNLTEGKGASAMKIFQNNLTDFQLITKFGDGIDKGLLVCHRFDALYFSNIKDSPKGSLELKVTDKTSSIDINRTKFKNLKSESTDFSTNGLSNLMYNNTPLFLDSTYCEFYKIKKDNYSLYYPNIAKISYKTPVFIGYRVGDIVTAESDKYEIHKFMIYKCTYNITNTSFVQEYELYAI